MSWDDTLSLEVLVLFKTLDWHRHAMMWERWSSHHRANARAYARFNWAWQSKRQRARDRRLVRAARARHTPWTPPPATPRPDLDALYRSKGAR